VPVHKQQKFRNEDGACKHCGTPEYAMHLGECPIYLVDVQHFYLSQRVHDETRAQLDKWDIQNHPMGTYNTGETKARADQARALTDQRAKDGTLTYRDILEEEFFEALAEEGPSEELEDELIQTAAVAVSMAAASRRARGVLK